MTESAGVWRQAGMGGELAGLDVQACLARPSAAECDAEAMEALLIAGESGALAGIRRRAARG